MIEFEFAVQTGLMILGAALAINILSRPGHGIWEFQIKISYAQTHTMTNF